MQMPSKEAVRIDQPPIAFISSFYKEVEYVDRHQSPLWQVRQELAALNEDQSLKRILGIDVSRTVAWVAEKSNEPLDSNPDKLAVVDRLVEVLHDAELYICILADRRRNDSDHGALIDVDGRPTNVSYFEIELYAAAMYGKPIIPYVLEGFDPGPRLKTLLDVLSWAFADWRGLQPQTAGQILRDVRKRIQQHVLSPQPPVSHRRELIHALYHHRAGTFAASSDGGLLFLDGAHEARPLPDRDRVESLIREYRRTPNYQRKLNRLWLAVRELMPVAYDPARTTPVMKEFFPYWDSVLGDWAAAASWQGWHGHLYAGTIAPLQSQYLIRSQGFPSRAEFQPEVVLPPDGALGSAYYSIASSLGGVYYWKSLRRAGQHVQRAIDARNGPSDNLLAIRGSVRLRMGLWPWAILDFTRMLRIREKTAAPPRKIADALMHLGEAHSMFFLSSKGRDLLRKAVTILEGYPDDPNLPRARRKLAAAYRLARQRKEAEDESRKAQLDAARLAAFDQLRR